MKRFRFIVGSLLIGLFLFHVTLSTLLLMQVIPYRKWFGVIGHLFAVIVIIHIVSLFFIKSEKDVRYYIKLITGLLVLVLLFVHGKDYIGPVTIGVIKLAKGLPVAIIESTMLIAVVLHVRTGLRSLVEQAGKEVTPRINYVACGIATIVILAAGYGIWSYLM